MSTLKLEYKRLRDPDSTLIWKYDYLTQDHMVKVSAMGYQGHFRKILNQWCYEQYGPRGDHRAWNYKYHNYGFARAEDAFAFIMRWGGASFPFTN